MPTADQRGHATLRSCAITELAIRIASPAVRLSECRHLAGVVATGTDRYRVIPTTDQHGLMAIRSRAVTELEKLILPPAVCLACGRNSAGVGVAATD